MAPQWGQGSATGKQPESVTRDTINLCVVSVPANMANDILVGTIKTDIVMAIDDVTVGVTTDSVE